MFSGHAEQQATGTFLDGKNIHPSQRRKFCNASVSAIAVGTYLGGMDLSTDKAVMQACMQALDQGVNFFDSAINYRGQRGERALGEALRQIFLKNLAKREQVFISTKGGFIPFEGEPTDDLVALFQRQYVEPGIAQTSDLISQCHCMTPAFLDTQLEKSRNNLGLETIDLYYLHNPETQLEEYPEKLFLERLFDAFKFLETAVAQGRIANYGLATWSGLRQAPEAHGHLPLLKIKEVARAAAPQGKDHLHAIQLPFNLAMLEGAYVGTQKISDHDNTQYPAMEAAQELGMSVAVSVPLYQGRLCYELPPFIAKNFPDAYTVSDMALDFAVSEPLVDAAMVGMKNPQHVTKNTAVLHRPRLLPHTIRSVIEGMVAGR